MGPLRVQYAFRTDGKPKTSAQATNLSKNANISIDIVHRETAFTVTIQSLLNYARAFEKDYGVRFADARTLDM